MIQKNRENKEPNFFYVLLLLIQPLIIVSLVLENQTLERVLSYLIYISALMIFIMRFLKYNANKTDCLLLMFLLFFILKILLFRDGMSSLVSFVSFFIMLIAYDASRDIKENQSIKKVIYFSYFLQAILFCFLSLSDYSHKSYVENTDFADVLTLGIANPNQTGIMLFVNIIVLWCMNRNVKTKYIKVVTFVLCAWMVILLLSTRARTSIFALIFTCVFYWLFRKKRNAVSCKYSLLKASMIGVIPLAFLIIYLRFSNIEFIQNIVIFEKKLISGREEVYQSVIDSWQNILFGDIAVFSFRNAHNAYLSVFTNIGVIGFLIFFIFMVIMIQKKVLCCHNAYSIIYWAFLSTFLIACTESALLIGGSIYFVMLFTLSFLLGSKQL